MNWDELVRSHSGRLQRIARAHGLDEASAADVVQATWAKAVERLHTLRDPGAVGGWLATTARRESISILRGRRRERLVDSYENVDRPDEGRPLDDEVATRDQCARVRTALRRLPARDRRLLTMLMDSRAPDYASVSVALGMPIGSIGPTRARSLAQLRRELLRPEPACPNL